MAEGGSLTLEGHVIRKVCVVVNEASGRAGANAPRIARDILAQVGLDARIHTPPPDELVAALKRALSEQPDLLILVAGDGTARTAAELCGRTGPLLAPLPGGTMNMLPHALSGARVLPTDFREFLLGGFSSAAGGGCAGGLMFSAD